MPLCGTLVEVAASTVLFAKQKRWKCASGKPSAPAEEVAVAITLMVLLLTSVQQQYATEGPTMLLINSHKACCN